MPLWRLLGADSGRWNQMVRTVFIVEDSDTSADSLEITLLSRADTTRPAGARPGN